MMEYRYEGNRNVKTETSEAVQWVYVRSRYHLIVARGEFNTGSIFSTTALFEMCQVKSTICHLVRIMVGLMISGNLSRLE